MQNKILLKNLVEVINGYTFRTALEEQVDGVFFVLQAKNIGGIMINEVGLPKIASGDFRTNAFARDGDVIISSRGSFRCGVLRSETKNIIAASSVFLLRPKTDVILPEYLAIYLNSRQGQRQINELSTGAAIDTILKKDLENIEVKVISTEKQQRVIEIYLNNQAQQKTLKQKQYLINKVSEGAINKLINS